MPALNNLHVDVRREAERAEFPVDRAVYAKAGKDPAEPILFAGSLAAPVCVFGRDLGKDEVALGQPLVGAGGRLVRRGLIRGFEPLGANRRDDALLESALDYSLLTNTVPYKPPGNKAYTNSVKERFRPFVTELLVEHWRGRHIISLGTEAFQWFAPHVPADRAAKFWAREDRFEADLSFEMAGKEVVLHPLPHPSPLNQRWYGQFPALLDARLAAIAATL